MSKARLFFVRLREGATSAEIGKPSISKYQRSSFENEMNNLILLAINRKNAPGSDMDSEYRVQNLLEERRLILKFFFSMMPNIEEFHVVEIVVNADSFFFEESNELSIWLSRYFRKGITQKFCYGVGLICEPLDFEMRQALQFACNQAFASFSFTQSVLKEEDFSGISGNFDTGYSFWYRNSESENGWDDLETEIPENIPDEITDGALNLNMEAQVIPNLTSRPNEGVIDFSIKPSNILEDRK